MHPDTSIMLPPYYYRQNPTFLVFRRIANQALIRLIGQKSLNFLCCAKDKQCQYEIIEWTWNQ